MKDNISVYKRLIEQAYIDPIRSVVVVDDDFPTLDRLLGLVEPAPASETTTAQKQENTSAESIFPEMKIRFQGQISEVQRAAALIRACRCRERPWSVDIHDGSAEGGVNELVFAPSLHHTDLMILDFHLNGDTGDGSRAIEILRALARNSQFNLVVVYTKGIDGYLSGVFQQIILGMLYSAWNYDLPHENLQKLEQFVADWEDETAVDIRRQILECVSVDTYIKVRVGKCSFEALNLQPVLQSLLSRCPASLIKSQNFSPSAKDIFDIAVIFRHKDLLAQLSSANLGELNYRFSEELSWLRLDQLFVTVVKKDTQPSEIVERLTSALTDWAPGPHQLLMTRMRGELSENGFLAEADVLSNISLQAGWLHELMNHTDATGVMSQSIERHWEALGDGLYNKVVHYASALVKYFRDQNREDVLRRYLDTEIDAELRVAHLNHYYSTKSIDSGHLTTGQIFCLDVGKPEIPEHEYWVCLSPACDMVPGRDSTGWKSRLGNAVPFIAVQLHVESKLKDALNRINENRFVFVARDGNLLALKFTKDSKISTPPIWEQMFALNNGTIDVAPKDTGHLSISIQRMSCALPGAIAAVGAEQAGDAGDPPPALAFSSVRAQIICQLRYEYALNLLQRLGSSLSRVGLDFQTFKA